MPRQTKYHVGIEIGRLTNSILNTISGDSFPTDVKEVTKADLKNINKKNGWNFSWLNEFKLPDRNVYKLTIINNPNVFQGLVSISDNNDHFYLRLIESAPFNRGKKKLYEGVGGNLFAFTCKISWDKDNEGFVLFTSKTKLIEYYQKAIGATHVGGQRMIIFPDAALKLIQKYYPNKQ
jgi:hypothetical protein